MSNDLNRCSFIGRLGKDPSIAYSKDGKAVANFSIACSDDYKNKTTGEKVEQTEWINLVAFGRLAEIIGEYLTKGSRVYVEGKFKTDKYEKDGVTRYNTKVFVNNLLMLDGKKPDQAQQKPAKSTVQDTGSDDFSDEIPF